MRHFFYKCNKCKFLSGEPNFIIFEPIKGVPPAKIVTGYCKTCDGMTHIFTGKASEDAQDYTSEPNPLSIEKELHDIQNRIESLGNKINKKRSIVRKLFFMLNDKSRQIRALKLLTQEKKVAEDRLSHSQLVYSLMEGLKSHAIAVYGKHNVPSRCLNCGAGIGSANLVEHSCGGELIPWFNGPYYTTRDDEFLTKYYNINGDIIDYRD